MQETETNEYNQHNKSAVSIDGIICDKWCQLIEKITRDAVVSALKDMRIESYAEVLITGISPTMNTVSCINLLSGEQLINIPNYSGIDLATLSENNTFDEMADSKRRGRIFITNTRDNPVYLGLWYDDKEKR